MLSHKLLESVGKFWKAESIGWELLLLYHAMWMKCVLSHISCGLWSNRPGEECPVTLWYEPLHHTGTTERLALFWLVQIRCLGSLIFSPYGTFFSAVINYLSSLKPFLKNSSNLCFVTSIAYFWLLRFLCVCFFALPMHVLNELAHFQCLFTVNEVLVFWWQKWKKWDPWVRILLNFNVF